MQYGEVQVLLHSSIRINGSKTLYFDPFRIDEEIYDADIVFVTHEHFDHFSPEDMKKVIKDETLFVMPASMKKCADRLPVSADRVTWLNPGESAEVLGVKIEAIPAYNMLKPFHTRSFGWIGYLVTMDDTVYYIAGDTDRTVENRQVKCDVALLPISGLYTMDASEAARLVNEMKPKAAIPTHYGSVVGSKWDAVKFFDSITEEDIIKRV